ncbi:MAG: D-alanyl-D-alanine carboxypeptidase family protein, partial [Firmicutes bacterium]|nr:D-alanyl-D-alanine carboxypeptidase family protein [Bacillota bacterium]
YQALDNKQEETATQQWLMKHCQDYGFILRYPNGRTETTGIIYEPWHYRYVGKKHAKYIMDNDLCFEDYIAELESRQKELKQQKYV